MKKSTFYALLLAASLGTIGGLALSAYLFDDNNKHVRNIRIHASQDPVSDKLQFNNLSLYPGDKTTYEMNTFFETSGLYDAKIVFTEQEDGGLKNYVVATLTADGEIIYKGSLKQLLGTTQWFELTPQKDETVNISLVYEMPLDVQNEAQGTYATFDAELTVGRDLKKE